MNVHKFYTGPIQALSCMKSLLTVFSITCVTNFLPITSGTTVGVHKRVSPGGTRLTAVLSCAEVIRLLCLVKELAETGDCSFF